MNQQNRTEIVKAIQSACRVASTSIGHRTYLSRLNSEHRLLVLELSGREIMSRQNYPTPTLTKAAETLLRKVYPDSFSQLDNYRPE